MRAGISDLESNSFSEEGDSMGIDLVVHFDRTNRGLNRAEGGRKEAIERRDIYH